MISHHLLKYQPLMTFREQNHEKIIQNFLNYLFLHYFMQLLRNFILGFHLIITKDLRYLMQSRFLLSFRFLLNFNCCQILFKILHFHLSGLNCPIQLLRGHHFKRMYPFQLHHPGFQGKMHQYPLKV